MTKNLPHQTDRDVGRLYGKVRITSEPYSNTLIITSNSKENLAAVEEVLKQLDTPSDAGESTLRIGLRFAKASTLANSINILFAKNGSPLCARTRLRASPNSNRSSNNSKTAIPLSPASTSNRKPRKKVIFHGSAGLRTTLARAMVDQTLARSAIWSAEFAPWRISAVTLCSFRPTFSIFHKCLNSSKSWTLKQSR